MLTRGQLKVNTEVLGSDELSVLSSVSAGSGLVAVAMYDFVDTEEFCQANISYIDNLFTTLLGEDKIKRAGQRHGRQHIQPVLVSPGTD